VNNKVNFRLESDRDDPHHEFVAFYSSKVSYNEEYFLFLKTGSLYSYD